MDTEQVVTIKKSKWATRKDRLRHLPWGPIVIISGLVLAGTLGPWLTPYSPYSPNLPERLQPPGGEYLLGTDTLGRDLLTRLIFGARVTLTVAISALLVGGGVGLCVGLIAGYYGGKVDIVLARLIDVFLSFPTIFFALIFAVLLQPSFSTVIVAIAVSLWARFARVIRGDVLSIKQGDFVAQARVAGCSDARIIVVHIIPYVVSTFMVLVSLDVGWVIIIESTLSFLGAGVPPPEPSWGSITAEGRQYISTAWWISTFPGLAITLIVLSFNLFGNWLRDTLDPRLREL
ncbi:ABC transporter permease [Chloroflexota bacterium]